MRYLMTKEREAKGEGEGSEGGHVAGEKTSKKARHFFERTRREDEGRTRGGREAGSEGERGERESEGEEEEEGRRGEREREEEETERDRQTERGRRGERRINGLDLIERPLRG